MRYFLCNLFQKIVRWFTYKASQLDDGDKNRKLPWVDILLANDPDSSSQDVLARWDAFRRKRLKSQSSLLNTENR